jgi:hypothetical protein
MRSLTAPCVVALVAGLAAPASAQEGQPCNIVLTGVQRGGVVTTRVTTVMDALGGRNTYVGGGVDATCEGQGNRLLADSADHFADRGLLILYHNVKYSEERVSIDSDKMFYYTVEERLVAEGNVRGLTASGTRFRGPRMEYFRAKPGFRDTPSWVAVGRPFLRMSPAEGGGTPGVEADSTDLTADRIYSENDSLVWASGRVVIERSDMRATSDSATMDNGTEFVRLLRDPKIVGLGERPFTLTGIVIDAWSRERELQRVLAAGDGRAVNDSLTLTGDTIDLRFEDQQIHRVFTWGGRARADAPEQEMEADSMDIRMPAQRLERVHAVGKAIALSRVDSAKIASDERDWIAGDTLVAEFETLPDLRTEGERTQMREVVATGSARSFYQLAQSGGERGPPSLSYNRGRVITVRFEQGEMSTVTVSEQASGLFLEPAPEAPPAPTTPTRRRP